MFKIVKKRYFIPSILSVFLLIGVSFKDDFFEISKQIEIFTTLFKTINQNYVDDTNPAELMDKAIKSMLADLDPYTNYFNEQDVIKFKINNTGEYTGIGAMITRKEDKLIIKEPYKGFPADKAGLKAGDEITQIGDVLLVDFKDDASQLMKGAKGTKININYLRQGKPMSTQLILDEVAVKAVPFYGMVDDKTGYIVLSQFNQKASYETKEALEKLKDDGATQIVLDLRGNPGGLLNEAVNICNLFVPKNEIIVTTKSKNSKYNNTYKTNKTKHFKQLQNNLEHNFAVREGLIEELKQLIDSGDSSIGDMFKKANDIRDRWKNAGAIPRDKYNILWNNYHFHMERFYDVIHLDKEARDLDLKNNLEQKQQIITKATALLNEEDVMKAFRELQLLHRVWKEEIGPVDREHREVIWNEFSEITKKMHDKREALYALARGKETENLALKNEIIVQIEALGTEKIDSHNGWQGQIKKLEILREAFFKAGKVPAEVTEETWAKFKNAVRAFNVHKNVFYKDIKHEQNDNLAKKIALVEKAKSLQESNDFNATTPIMKQIQDDWKKIGHVPRKYSDSIWNDFKLACNAYFDRMHEARNSENSEEVEAFEKKKAFLDELKDFTLVGEHKADLDAIKAHIATWKTFGKVPFNRRHIEGKFNKILDALFEKLSMSKKDTEMMRFSNRIEQLSENDNKRALEQEQFFIRKKIDEVQSEIFQLENNIQFISSSSKGENPFIKEVQKSIERHKDDLKLWKEKLQQIKDK